jgi:hypothetical protein
VHGDGIATVGFECVEAGREKVSPHSVDDDVAARAGGLPDCVDERVRIGRERLVRLERGPKTASAAH